MKTEDINDTQWEVANLPDVAIVNVLEALQGCSLLTNEQRNLINYLPYGYMIDQVVRQIKNYKHVDRKR